MQKFIFSVYDMKSKVFSIPFFSVNQATALRDFERACRDVNSDLNAFPNDFSLYELGSFDDNTGLISTHTQPDYLALAAQFKEV